MMLSLALGISLAAACGFRVFVPLLVLGLFPDGSWIEQKTYPDGTVDKAAFCDWGKGNAWWERQKGVELLCNVKLCLSIQ